MIPVILGGIAGAALVYGIKKSLDAKKILEKAKEIGKRAERKHRRAVEELEAKREETFAALEALGQKKAEIFKSAGRAVIDLIEQARARAEIQAYETTSLPVEEISAISQDIAQIETLEVAVSAGKGLGMAALGATGIYGAVGALATASTGTAIASLSGAAATNATLAWLGGGSLAAGGLGIAGGTWVLGGIVAGPALAIVGFSLASEAEKALTQAEEYAAEVEQKIAALESVRVALEGIDTGIQETQTVLDRLYAAFEATVTQYRDLNEKRSFAGWAGWWWKRITGKLDQERERRLMRVIAVFKAIKEVVQTPLLDEQSMPVTGLKERFAEVIEVNNITLPPLKEKADDSEGENR